MMDLKDIIKWFVPCFHLLLMKKIRKNDVKLTLVCCLFLFFISSVACDAEVSDSVEKTLLNENFNLSSKSKHENVNNSVENGERNFKESLSTGRTFGRPFKKMIAGLLPIIFSMGAASTWAVVATLVGIKTLAVTLLILKIILVAGAAKVGAIFGAKHHHQKPQEWTPPQKEIHLHIHNGQGHQEVVHEDPYHHSPWSREGVIMPVQHQGESKNVVVAYDPYSGPQQQLGAQQGPQQQFGPQTISTPYGNYVRVDQIQSLKVRKKRSSKVN